MSNPPVRTLNEPICYLMMRTDLDSMNPGKAMAQAHHAYGAMKRAMKDNPDLQRDYIAWQDQTKQDFGTVITLGGIYNQIDRIIERAKNDTLICGGWVHDPTYPVPDGDVTHLISIRTCAFLFGERTELRFLTNSLGLHP